MSETWPSARDNTKGLLTVTTSGTNLDLTSLTTPGRLVVANTDETNYVEMGIYDASSSRFFPLIEIQPGVLINIPLSRNVGEEYYSTTGTDAGNSVQFRANTASVDLFIECHEA